MIENLEEIKRDLDIERVLQEIGYSESNPKRTGSEIRDFCPVHGGDKQHSLCINISSKVCYCQNPECSFTGDLIELYMKSKNVDFDEAVKILAPLAGVEIKYSCATKTDMPQDMLTPQDVLDRSTNRGEHPYLKTKKIEAWDGLFFGTDARGNYSIVVPFWKVGGELATVQFINSNGKFFLSGYSYIGAFFCTSDSITSDTVYLAEGLATALTIWMALDELSPTVISFGSANNLVHVVNALKSKYPKLNLIICLDNNEAAFAQVRKLNKDFQCSYRLPSFDGMISSDNSKALADFNDIISKCNQPISIVKDQLMKELSASDLPIKKTVEETVTEAPKSDVTLSSFNTEYQEEILAYLLNQQTLESVMQDGFSSKNFESYIFTGHYRLAIDGIIKSWEQDLPVSISQIAINSGNSSLKFYETLKRIETRPSITAKQIPDRLKQLNQHHAQSKLNNLIAAVQNNNQPLSEQCDILRKGADEIQGTAVTMFPQAHYLPQIIDNIINPKSEPLITGIKSLDRLLGGGFKKTELGMLAGGAGAGKTAFALQIADSIAKNGGIVIYISVEIGISKLTERSLKRLSYELQSGIPQSFENCVAEYQRIANNVYLVKGQHGMLVSEIRGMILSVMRQRNVNNILTIIDPFQRLGTGNENLDFSSETTKVSTLCSQIKEMAESLNIPILALSDTVKSHKDNKSGEGAIRGSYMADHTADYVMMLRASRIAMKAIYTEIPSDNDKQEDPFISKVERALGSSAFTDTRGRYALKNDNDVYASLVTSKVRDGGKFSPLFVYRPAYHLFEDTELWESIFNASNTCK